MWVQYVWWYVKSILGEGATEGGEHAVLMCTDRFHSPTASALSLRSVIILSVVWPSPSTPAGIPSLMPKSLSQNVDASKTQSTRPLSRMKLILSLGQGVCYHRAVSSCRACFRKECQCWFKPSPFICHVIWKKCHTAHFLPQYFTHNVYAHTKKEAHSKNSTLLSTAEVKNTTFRPHEVAYLLLAWFSAGERTSKWKASGFLSSSSCVGAYTHTRKVSYTEIWGL